MLTTPSGNPASWISSPKRRAESGVCSARLEHDRASRRQRRRQLPRRHHEGEIPRDDLADDADRLAQRVGVPVAGARDRDRLAVQSRRPSRHVAEHVDRALHVALAGVGHRLAVVERLEFGELVAHAVREGRPGARRAAISRPARCATTDRFRRRGAPQRPPDRYRPCRRPARGRSISSVAGSSTAKVLPLRASTHFPSIRSLRSFARNAVAAEPSAGFLMAIVITDLPVSMFC